MWYLIEKLISTSIRLYTFIHYITSTKINDFTINHIEQYEKVLKKLNIDSKNSRELFI